MAVITVLANDPTDVTFTNLRADPGRQFYFAIHAVIVFAQKLILPVACTFNFDRVRRRPDNLPDTLVQGALHSFGMPGKV